MTDNTRLRGEILIGGNIVISIILGKNYLSYSQALGDLKMETLKERQKTLCLNFANKAQKFKSWFQTSDKITSKFNPVSTDQNITKTLHYHT